MIYLIICAVLLVLVVWAYNQGVQLRNYVKEAFSTMDVYLKKRWDLIPNLVEVVNNYSGYEKGLLAQITELRSKNYADMTDSGKIDTNMALGANLSKIIAVAEKYPDIKANQTFEKLMQELSNIEDAIANARKYYNGTVREYNNYLELFPTSLIGKMANFEKAKMFEITDNERQNTRVDL